LKLAARLLEHGLHLRGVVNLEPGEAEALGLAPGARAIALIGNIGSSYWPAFREAPEFRDGEADPLDRWSRRVAESVAAEFSLQPLYPFQGPPYLPFQRWAERAEGLAQSPLGIMIHAEYGLWHSYRFALRGDSFDAEPAGDAGESPCIACSGKPCLRVCPVEAFDGEAFAVDACAGYLRRTPAADCHHRGCLARLACPVAREFRYLPEQAAFHLQAFLRAQVKS
jgi:hypothetical protein